MNNTSALSLIVRLCCSVACCAVLLFSCTDEEPVAPSAQVDSLARGVYILCEGLWKMDNATLTRYNPGNGRVENNFFSAANPGLRIGDTGNDIVLRGDTAYIAVTTSRTIEIFRASTGTWLHRIRFDNGNMPRHIALAPDGAYVSTYTGQSISRFDPRTFAPMGGDIPSGPAVEGIAYAGGSVFAANSGLGSLQIDSPKAGTLSVVRLGSGRPDTLLYAAPNVAELVASPDGTKLYAVSHEIAGRPDIIPVIIEYDAAARTELRRWQVERAYSPCLNPRGDSLFFISKAGVDVLDLRVPAAVPQTVVPRDRMDDNWYTLAYHPVDGTLWIGNARGYTTEGEVIVAAVNGEYLHRFDVGINPTAIVFFGYE